MFTRRGDEAKCDVAGDGPARQELQALASELRLNGHVRFLGFRRDVRTLPPSAGLFVLCSLSEGLAISILEAMAAGLPVVATDVGGNGEVVRHGETGLLVPPQDPVALAGTVDALLADPDRRRAYGAAGRRDVAARFSWPAVVERVLAAYEDALAGRGSRVEGRRSDV